MESISGAIGGLIVFLIALNIAGQLLYLRLDLSEGKIYSPSKASKRILKSLEDPVIVKCYFSKELPQPYATYRDYLKDLLRSYKNYGGKNFEYRFISYPEDEKFKSEALTMGVAPVRLTFIAKDKYEIKDGFMGAVLLHADKKETIAVIRDIAGLEYDLTSRIKKLVQKEPRVAAILDGKGTAPLSSEIMDNVRENYEVRHFDVGRPLDLTGAPQSLLIIGPKENFTEGEMARLEQMILAGVPTAFFLDTKDVNMDSGAFFASNVATGLEKLLGHWGLGLKNGFALDIQNQNISIQQRAGPFIINNIVSYPLLPIITKLSRESPITKEMDQVMLPFVSPVSTDNVKNMNLEVLAETSRLSWIKTNLTSLSPLADFTPAPGDPRGPFAVAVTLEGKLSALFASPPADLEKSTPPASGAWLAQSKNRSRIILVGTSKIVDQSIPAGASNLVFFLNVVDWLSQDADLAAVRSKGMKIRPFTRTLSDYQRTLVKFASILLMPVCVAAAGFAGWRRRKRWKASVREQFTSSAA